MRPKSLATGMATVPLVLLYLIPSCAARPKSHAHHHNERLPRIARSSPASFETSTVTNPTAGICNPNNILARAIAGIPLDSEACSPNGSAPKSSMDVFIPASAPTKTVVLEVREEFRWPGWNHGPHFERVTYTRSRRAATSMISSSTAGALSSDKAGLLSNSTMTNSPLSPRATSVCPSGNGTSVESNAGKEYQFICNIDFSDNDFPFQLVQSFDDCLAACDAFNTRVGSNQCVAALFVPGRLHDADDCYLKYSVEHPSKATVGIEGAMLVTSTQSFSQSKQTSTTSTSSSTQSHSTSGSKSYSASLPTQSSKSRTSSSAAASSTAPVSQAGVTYASGKSAISPKLSSTKLHGPTHNQPSKQYVQVAHFEELLTLSSSLLTIGVNGDLSTNYDLSSNTGALEVDASTQSLLSSISDVPHLSRDGGRGGYLNGEHLFFFCDTGSYTTTTADSNGDFLGFVSSSVAVDVGMNGLNGKPLTLQDGIGEWSDNTGRMRSFAPLTQGEEGYNQVMQGKGGRYAIWPESALIPLDATTALMYAPIVYDNVNTATKAAVFTYTGATLLTITAGGKGGPVAARANKKIFYEGEVEWGCAGGIRSWGSSGIGGSDGTVYLFGNINGGILLARTSPGDVADRDSYEYWNGKSWTSGMQTSTSKAYFIDGPIMDIDVFYSPRHLTFIAVYLTIYADSTFYYRYLEADQVILPPYAPGGDKSSDFVENILKYTWSDQQVLYKATTGLSGKYIYSGGVHANYYGSNDITNGGSKMLLSWTAPTGLDPSTQTSEYQIITAEIDWH